MVVPRHKLVVVSMGSTVDVQHPVERVLHEGVCEMLSGDCRLASSAPDLPLSV